MGRQVKKLSVRTVETITEAGLHADGDCLYLQVDKSGARRWVFIYHSQGRRREMGLGRMGLKDARDAADVVRRQIREGKDPIAARRDARSLSASIPTFAVISREVIAEAQRRSTNAKVRYQWELLLGPRYCSTILDKPVNEITTLDVERVLRPVWLEKPETARKMLSRLQRVFDYARVHLRDKNGIVMRDNPADWRDLRDRGFERPTKLSRGRQAALDYVAASEFLKVVRSRGSMAARAMEITLLTALRTSEVIGARWSEIDLDKKVWTIPPERLKDRRTRTEPHRIPLSTQVIEWLSRLPRLGDYVFPGQKVGKPLSNMAMPQLLKNMNVDADGKPIWVDVKSGRGVTPHGFRATFRTWGEDQGHERDLLEEALGHQIGTVVEKAYRRTDSLERRRAVMQAWADFCSGTVCGQAL